MKKTRFNLIIPALLLLFNFSLSSCSKDDEVTPAYGTVSGIVLAYENDQPLADVNVSVFHADSNAPVGENTTTNEEGNFSIDLEPGTYFLRLATLGYQEAPPVGVAAIPFTITAGLTTKLEYDLVKLTDQDVGAISGQIQNNGQGMAGVLVTATNANGDIAYSAISGQDGHYTIWNVPTGSYQVKGYIKAFDSEVITTNTSQAQITEGVNINMTSGGVASLDGSVKFLATGNKIVDVALIHPLTKQAIPGLATTTSGSFTLNDIPDGVYLARASYNNDSLVVDPDFIVKFGEPVVSVEAGNATVSQGESIKNVLDFAVTGAILLEGPTNDPAEIIPMETSAAGLTFSWKAYSSTSDYVIELQDINGNIIWGGFDTTGETPIKNISTKATSITYDGPALRAGRIYRWKVYASKDQNNTGGWSLISMSEDQMGLIQIVE
ncbi:carboxypeptidase-like regulatory domain-containing protein [Persicobacter diffluens]|uniref:Carboxypeptidase regulatory-like domain-containing protein n=1 Tax=Persicobacter diffluens TaxID=981 RepID=A0AAN4W3T2_9BACT|nr:hypothetical protein PEDI_40220 [Persicobacter diffluens]